MVLPLAPPPGHPGIPSQRTQGIYSREDFEGLLTTFEDFDQVGDAKYKANVYLYDGDLADIEMRVIRKQSSIKAMVEFYGEQEILGHLNLFDFLMDYWND